MADRIAETTVATTEGAGVVSTPPSAKAGTASTHSSAQVSANRLSMVLSPFSQDRPIPVIVRHNATFEESAFARIYRENPSEALRYCDAVLRRLRADDRDSYVKWSASAAMAQRALCDPRAALRTHLFANPIAFLICNPLTLGNHTHGLAFTLMCLGEHADALEGFYEAKKLFVRAKCAKYAAAADNNAGLVLVKMGRASEAVPLIKDAISVAEGLRDFALAAEFADTLKRAFCQADARPETTERPKAGRGFEMSRDVTGAKA